MMDDKRKLEPQIRFRGFTDTWEKRKLGRLAEFSKGNGYSKGDLTPAGTPIILYGRLYTKYETVIEDVDTFVEMKDKSVVSNGGEVIVPSSGETAEDISRASVVGKAGIILGGDLNIVKPNSEIHPAFLAIAISNGNQQKELSKRAQGKSVVHISNSDLKDVALQLPSLPEQTSIGNFFRTLDTTIALHKRKLDGLRKLKKAYLQQMFPQAGENVPRLRFRGFTGDWEQRKLGEVLIKNSEKNKEQTISNVESVSNKFGFVKQDEYFEERKIASNDTSNYYVIRKGAFAYNPSRINVGSIAVKENDETSVVSPLYISFYTTEHLGIAFLWNWFKTSQFEKGRLFLTAGGVRDTLSYEALQEMYVTLPKISEQIAIGNFFRNLDEQITAQAKKLEHLKKLKSAYLQKMFV